MNFFDGLTVALCVVGMVGAGVFGYMLGQIDAYTDSTRRRK